MPPPPAAAGGTNPFNFLKVNDVIKQEFSNNDVVDCPACRKLGIDPEIEPKAGEVDTRPRTRTKAFAVYGGKQNKNKNKSASFCLFVLYIRIHPYLTTENAYAFPVLRYG